MRFEPLPFKPGQNSLWKLGQRPSIKHRRENRLIIPLEVMVETLDESGQPAKQEYTVTETISSLGACVPTSLEVDVGRIVRIKGVRDPVSVFAAIRSREVTNGVAHLGLEFIGGRWPLDKE